MSESGRTLTLDHACADGLSWLQALAEDGPDLRVNAHKKALNEAVEFAVEGDIAEAADVLLCLVGALDHQGYSISDLAEAVAAKVQVNRARTWQQQDDGTWQHVATAPARNDR